MKKKRIKEKKMWTKKKKVGTNPGTLAALWGVVNDQLGRVWKE